MDQFDLLAQAIRTRLGRFIDSFNGCSHRRTSLPITLAPFPGAPKKTYVAPTRRSLRQHEAKQKAVRKAAAVAAAPAAPVAEQPAQG